MILGFDNHWIKHCHILPCKFYDRKLPVTSTQHLDETAQPAEQYSDISWCAHTKGTLRKVTKLLSP